MSDLPEHNSNRTGITAVTVTYGDRWCYLEVLLQRLEEEKLVQDVVVIDNASKLDIATACVEAGFTKVHVYRQEQNMGSAGGYKAGIEAAITLSGEFIMLYDDDVVPLDNCVELLQLTFEKLSRKQPYNSLVIIPYRESHHSKITLEEKPLLFRKYSFQGLNVFNFIQRHFFYEGRPVDKSGFQVARQNGAAAYACLYFHKTLIDLIGLPDPKFVLYYDDVEFTSRLLNKGGEIWLELDAHCDDICSNYSMDVFSPPFLGYLRADNDSKIFYMIRNRTYIDRFIDKVVSPYYIINVVVLFIGVAFLGLFTRKSGRVKTIYRAFFDGFNGNMGMHRDFPLT